MWGCVVRRVGAIWRCVGGDRGSTWMRGGAGRLKTIRSRGIGSWCLLCARGEVKLRYCVCGDGGREEGGRGKD